MNRRIRCLGTLALVAGGLLLVSCSEVASGFVNAANPDASLIFTKPRSTAHGGGVVAEFADADIARIKEWVTLQPILNLNVLEAVPVASMIAKMITTGPTDVRADVDAHGVYNPANQVWTLEMRRRLVAGDSRPFLFRSHAHDHPLESKSCHIHA